MHLVPEPVARKNEDCIAAATCDTPDACQGRRPKQACMSGVCKDSGFVDDDPPVGLPPWRTNVASSKRHFATVRPSRPSPSVLTPVGATPSAIRPPSATTASASVLAQSKTGPHAPAARNARRNTAPMACAVRVGIVANARPSVRRTMRARLPATTPRPARAAIAKPRVPRTGAAVAPSKTTAPATPRLSQGPAPKRCPFCAPGRRIASRRLHARHRSPPHRQLRRRHRHQCLHRPPHHRRHRRCRHRRRRYLHRLHRRLRRRWSALSTRIAQRRETWAAINGTTFVFHMVCGGSVP